MGICASIEHQTTGVVESCGDYSRLATPGLNVFNIFCGETLRGVVSLRLQQLDVSCETKTHDNVFITLMCSVQYQVIPGRVYDAFYQLTDHTQQIRAYVFDAVRAEVPKMILDDVFEQKDDIARVVREEVSRAMEPYGFEIIQALITDINTDHKVKEAMNEINASQRMRVAAREKAEAEKTLLVKAAEADAESKFLAGTGIARQRKALIEGLRDSVVDFSEQIPGSSAKEVMDLVLITQYFDTLKELGAKSRTSTLFVPHSPAAVGEVAEEIKRGFGSNNQMQLPHSGASHGFARQLSSSSLASSAVSMGSSSGTSLLDTVNHN